MSAATEPFPTIDGIMRKPLWKRKPGETAQIKNAENCIE
jgi:hypothetical protein